MTSDGIERITDPDESLDNLRQRIRNHALADETSVLDALLPLADLDHACSSRAQRTAGQLIEVIRQRQAHKSGVDALLNEFSLSSAEGVVLMRLAEALLRVPDTATADLLIADLLAEGDWAAHIGRDQGLFVNTSAGALLLTARLAACGDNNRHARHALIKRLTGRLGQPLIRAALRFAMGLMGDNFVMAGNIDDALIRARRLESRGYRYSYDMLGEGARTAADARRYLDNYLIAIAAIGAASRGLGAAASPGISVKLSALHPRYEFLQRPRVMSELVARLEQLAVAAKAQGIGLTVDAEEARRLELSLDVIEAVFSSTALAEWEGFGIAVQAYQKRALPVIDWCRDLARARGRRLAVRLVKGAYWDTEIKLAQIQGLDDYPVFTRKIATDVSYQACARRLLACRDWLYPQFATHNASTVATILALDDNREGYEFQRLYGMGEALYEEVSNRFAMPCRIYAPIGKHDDLLSYLVRRLLENGANSSFVSRVLDTSIPDSDLTRDPVARLRSLSCRCSATIVLPKDLYGCGRRNARGADLSDPRVVAELQLAVARYRNQGNATTCPGSIAVLNPANLSEQVGSHQSYASDADIKAAVQAASAALGNWCHWPVAERARLINRLADTLEEHRDELLSLCVREAGKTLADSIAEVREAVDFCRYYAQQAEQLLTSGTYRPRGVLLCISPWNFPLAIFVGQMIAALVVGNTVVAKPAEQTSLLARRALAMLYQCGLPKGAVQLLISPGRPVGELLVPDPRIRGVLFTGSCATAQWLNRALAERPDSPLPLVAETGGQNAMIVDSSALPEQVVDDVIRSGFHSAGQRCSSLRVLFLQAEIASRVIDMLKGAMAELGIGDPALPSTDVGPLIDARALARLNEHGDYMEKHGKLLHRCELPPKCGQGYFFSPTLYEISNLSVLRDEVFGPVIHVIRYPAEDLDKVIAQINASGYGLTLGVHTRNPARADHIARSVRVGNVYVNRDMIGAVVGVQPFGGRGLSGTGPKAGGPHYLPHLVAPRHQEAAPARQPSPSPSPVNTAFPMATPQPTLVADLHGAGAVWESTPAAIRRDRLRSVLDDLHQQRLVSTQWLATMTDVLDQAVTLMGEATVMPGPTGESNRLLLESRGVTLNLLTESAGLQNGQQQGLQHELQQWLGGMIAALAAGNPVLMLVPQPLQAVVADCQQIVTNMKLSGTPYRMAVLAHPEELGVVVDAPDTAALILSAASSWRTALARILAARRGAILPMICEPPGRAQLMRLVSEKTVTINTTAAGGNPALMMDDTD